MAGKDKKPPNSYFSVACGLRGQIIALLSLLIVLPFCTPYNHFFRHKVFRKLGKYTPTEVNFLRVFYPLAESDAGNIDLADKH